MVSDIKPERFVPSNNMKEKHEKTMFSALSRRGDWVECLKCHALMYNTMDVCWSCKIGLTKKNTIPVPL